MERLWTPWRMEYISNLGEPPEGCLFCELPRREPSRDGEHLILRRGQKVFALLNLFPYNTGHLMVAPYQHGADFPALAPEVASELFSMAQALVATIEAEYRPDGFNIGMNLGRVAGAGIPDHLHLHVVPRWSGDANFMPITADTKVLPETLARTWERLRSGG